MMKRTAVQPWTGIGGIGASAALAGALLVLAAPPAAAQDDAAERWRLRSRQIERTLADDKPVRAARAAHRAVLDLVPSLAGGADDARILGDLLVLEAVAESATGDNAQALWLWSLAQSIDPALTAADLSRFGAPARLLADRPLRERARDGQIATEEGEDQPGVFERTATAEPPRLIKLPDPDYPAAARDAGLQGAVILQVVVDRQGRTRGPLAIESPAAALTYAAAEAVHEARFEPARLDGKPVAVYYDIRVDFRP
jgi:TonB family protein